MEEAGSSDSTASCLSMKRIMVASENDEYSGSPKRLPREREKTSVEKLQELLSAHYPQYGSVPYERIIVKTGEDSHKYRCRAMLFDMALESRDLYGDWGEAREALARIGYDLLVEFERVVLSRANDERFGRLFRPLLEEMGRQTAPPMPDVVEEEKVRMGLAKVLSVDFAREEESAKLQQQILSPLLVAIFQKMSSTTMLAAAPAEPAAKDKSCVASPAPPPASASQPTPESGDLQERLAIDPVSAIFSHYQKRSSVVPEPKFEFFSKFSHEAKHPLFGCLGIYDGKEYLVEAVCKTKNDAKIEVARKMCQATFGNADQEKAPKNFVFATSRDMIKQSATSTEPKPLDAAPGNNNNFGTKIMPATEAIKIDPLPNARFVSVVNEWCQRNRIPLPEYKFHSGLSLTTFYVCFIENFVDGPAAKHEHFVSAAFSRKGLAKEDCAARIFLRLVEKGAMRADGKPAVSAPPPAKKIETPSPSAFPIPPLPFLPLPPPGDKPGEAAAPGNTFAQFGYHPPFADPNMMMAAGGWPPMLSSFPYMMPPPPELLQAMGSQFFPPQFCYPPPIMMQPGVYPASGGATDAGSQPSPPLTTSGYSLYSSPLFNQATQKQAISGVAKPVSQSKVVCCLCGVG